MDEMKSKMLAADRPGDTLQAADRLYNTITTKMKAGAKDVEELALVWDLLGSAQVSCSQTCGHLLVKLVRNQYIPPQPAITQLLSRLSHGMSYDGIVPAVGQLLAALVEGSKESTAAYKCPYGISSNQHPFISLLRSTPATWDLVLDQCLSLLNHPNEIVKAGALEVLRPVLLYLFCDPNYHIHFGPIRAVLFNTLLKRSEESPTYFSTLSSLVAWMPFNQRPAFSEMYRYIMSYFQFLVQHDKVQILKEKIILVTSLMFYQVKFGLDITSSLNFLRSFVDQPSIVVSWDTHVVIFNKMLNAAPLGVENPILEFCVDLLKLDKVSKLVAGCLVCSMLECLSFESSITSSTSSRAEIIRICQSKDWSETVCAETLPVKYLDGVVHNSTEFVIAANKLVSSSAVRLKWLENLVLLRPSSLSQFQPLLSSIFILTNSSEEAKLTLELLLRCVKESPGRSASVLTLLLHKLANADKTQEPEIKLALLHALPSMAGDKGCVSLILKLLGSFGSKPSLTPLRLNLLLKLWRVEPRVFQFLHKALEEAPAEALFSQIQITRAMVIKEIVSTHAGQYGSDLLPTISAILNQCSSSQNTVAAKLALQSIYILCKESVIDIRTTVKVIAPKCSRDQRPTVLEEYCSILGLVPSFRLSGADYVKFTEETLSWLWKIASNSADPSLATSTMSVVAAAYNAIAQYPLEAHKLKMLPGFAREGLKLPGKYCSTPADAARKPEDVLPYVPCECWVKLLRPCGGQVEPQSPPVQEAKKTLLRALLKTEVENLPRSVYHVSGGTQSSGTEPVNYNHLPEYSILRGIFHQLLATKNLILAQPGAGTESEAVSQICLELLSTDFGRTLPPFDWLSLEGFLDRADLRPGFVATIALLGANSRSARIIVERQLGSELEPTTESLYMAELPNFALYVPPQILATFTARCLKSSLKLAAVESKTEQFKSYSDSLRKALIKPGVPDPSLVALANSLEGIYEAVPTDLDGFNDFIEAVSVLPNKNIERLSSPALWWEVTPQKISRAASLRTKLALCDATDTPLTWLNELLEVAGKQSGDYSFLLRNLVVVLESARKKSKQSVQSWLLELMGQVSGILRKPDTHQTAAFLVDVFNVAVVVLTGTETICIPRDQLCISRSARQLLLPSALSRICSSTPAICGQLSDWILRLSKKGLPNNISECMVDCLPVFKQAENWREALMWGRIVLN